MHSLPSKPDKRCHHRSHGSRRYDDRSNGEASESSKEVSASPAVPPARGSPCLPGKHSSRPPRPLSRRRAIPGSSGAVPVVARIVRRGSELRPRRGVLPAARRRRKRRRRRLAAPLPRTARFPFAGRSLLPTNERSRSPLSKLARGRATTPVRDLRRRRLGARYDESCAPLDAVMRELA
jgi:hypothetical protein